MSDPNYAVLRDDHGRPQLRFARLLEHPPERCQGRSPAARGRGGAAETAGPAPTARVNLPRRR
jgi:hypothetical protein